jgi:hypothetical protein
MSLKRVLTMCVALMSIFAAVGVAQACPMCSQSIAEDDSLPKAFMYSIIFMLGMPATVLCGIGSVIYFKFRHFSATQQIGVAGDDLVTMPGGDRSPLADSSECSDQVS